jgi:adenylylsulfate kinase
MEKGLRVKVLELDEIRKVLTPQPAYSEEERSIVYAAIAYMAKILTDEGVNVIVDATANLKKYREVAAKLIPAFGEIYVQCPIEICMAREAIRKSGHAPHDIYKKGMGGQSHTVPGLNVPYEVPEHPIAIINTEKESKEQAAVMAANAVLQWAGK